MRKAIVLHSGGLDSSTALVMALEEGFSVIPLSVSYGQRHAVELEHAEALLHWLDDRIPYHERIHPRRMVTVGGLGALSALTSDLAVPKDRDGEEVGKDIPVTYVPARNSIMLAIATSLAESEGAEAVFVGFNALDYSGYPDCRPEYVEAMWNALAQGTRRGAEGKPIAIRAPIIDWSKERIALWAAKHFPISLTWSCYDPQEGDNGVSVPCGRCDSCKIRHVALEAIKYPAGFALAL